MQCVEEAHVRRYGTTKFHSLNVACRVLGSRTHENCDLTVKVSWRRSYISNDIFITTLATVSEGFLIPPLLYMHQFLILILERRLRGDTSF